MTTFISDTAGPKALAAQRFAAELERALAARDVSANELCRTLGVGRTTLWHYRHARTLPRLEAAAALAGALDWPKLEALVRKARTRTCARPGCGRTFINDVGSEAKRYCEPACSAIVDSQKAAAARARRANRDDSQQARRAHVQRLRAAVRFADERATLRDAAIADMCAGCEPGGLCRMADCPLRPFSPLPLVSHDAADQPRTKAAVLAASWTPERRERFVASMQERWSDPANRAELSERMTAWHARETPIEKAERIAKAKAAYPATRRSATSRRVHAARRSA